jgi:hypothetical protein
LVLVRLINKNTVNADELVRAANTQNAMEPRNLHSNRIEQRAIERELATLGWFYERKDGSLDALKEAKRTSFGTQITTLQVRKERRGRKTIRACDNREVARHWLAFIGFSDEGKNQRRRLFPEDAKGLYQKVFLQTPSLHHACWLKRKANGRPLEFEDGRPPASWMLYASHLHQLVDYLTPVATKVRSEVRRELVAAGREPTIASVNEGLLRDDVNRRKFILSMLSYVITELVGYIFCNALGSSWLSPQALIKLMQSGAIGHFHEVAEFSENVSKEGVLSLDKDQIKNDPALIAIRMAVEAIDATLRKPEYRSSFLSSERKSRYVESDQLVKAYIEMVDEYDKYLSGPNTFLDWWREGSPTNSIRQLVS